MHFIEEDANKNAIFSCITHANQVRTSKETAAWNKHFKPLLTVGPLIYEKWRQYSVGSSSQHKRHVLREKWDFLLLSSRELDVQYFCLVSLGCGTGSRRYYDGGRERIRFVMHLSRGAISPFIINNTK